VFDKFFRGYVLLDFSIFGFNLVAFAVPNIVSLRSTIFFVLLLKAAAAAIEAGGPSKIASLD
jgi:hypothetical protein